ncbi:hypothetical protein U1Q18_037480 [Sarracenia purpurea var. burkii]
MGESGVPENEASEQIDWDHMLENIPEDLSLFDPFPLSNLSSSSPDSFSFSIGEIEQLLMEDDNGKVAVEDQLPREFSNDFLGDLLLDSPVESARFAEIVDHPDSCRNSNSSSSSEEERNRNGVLPQEESTGDGEDPIS